MSTTVQAPVVRVSRCALYGLQAAVELAAASPRPVPVHAMSERHGIPRAALAKVLQQLVHAGIVYGRRGLGGGYRLTRPPASISVLDLLEVIDGRPTEPSPARRRGPPQHPATVPVERLAALFDELGETARTALASVTLDTLVRGRL